jgi:hypothetical protein
MVNMGAMSTRRYGFTLRPVLLLLATLSCGIDDLPPPEWLYGQWSTWGPARATDHLERLEFLDDGRVRYETESGCGSFSESLDHSWVQESEDTVIIRPGDDPLYGYDYLRVRRDDDECGQLWVTPVVDEMELPTYRLVEGELCLVPVTDCGFDCVPCTTAWCDAPPPGC